MVCSSLSGTEIIYIGSRLLLQKTLEWGREAVITIHAGALRDMVQNHLLQMVGLTAMEPPSSLDADAIRNEVLKVFQSLQPIREEDVACPGYQGTVYSISYTG